VSQLVTAAEGGTVPVAGGSIAIPAGALSADTTITATVSEPSSSTPSSDKVAGKLLELGPDGTTFTMPVTLTLPLTKTPGANQSASLAYLDTTVTPNAWVTTPSTVADGKVSAGIMHFSTWTIIITVNGGAAPDCSFTKCGGALGGTYKVTGACIGGITDDLTKSCDGITATADVSVTGGITLNTDGTYMSDFNATMIKINLNYPASCLPPGATCDALAQSFSKNADSGNTASCVAAGGGCACMITQVNNKLDPPESGTWSSTADGTYTSMKTGETKVDDGPNEYCVSGNILKLSGTDEDGDTTVIVLQKQ
jgi:hypothetical protein